MVWVAAAGVTALRSGRRRSSSSGTSPMMISKSKSSSFPLLILLLVSLHSLFPATTCFAKLLRAGWPPVAGGHRGWGTAGPSTGDPSRSYYGDAMYPRPGDPPYHGVAGTARAPARAPPQRQMRDPYARTSQAPASSFNYAPLNSPQGQVQQGASSAQQPTSGGSSTSFLSSLFGTGGRTSSSSGAPAASISVAQRLRQFVQGPPILQDGLKKPLLAAEVRKLHESRAQYCCCFSRRQQCCSASRRDRCRTDCDCSCDCGGGGYGWNYGNDYWSGYQMGVLNGLDSHSGHVSPEGTFTRDFCCGPCYNWGYQDGKTFGAQLADSVDRHPGAYYGDGLHHGYLAPFDGGPSGAGAGSTPINTPYSSCGDPQVDHVVRAHETIMHGGDGGAGLGHHLHHAAQHMSGSGPPENLHGDSCCPCASGGTHDICTLPGDSCCTNDNGKIDGCHFCCTHRPPGDNDPQCCGLVQPDLHHEQCHKCCCIDGQNEVNPCACCLQTQGEGADQFQQCDMCCCVRFCCHTESNHLACCNPGGCCGECGNLDPQHGEICCHGCGNCDNLKCDNCCPSGGGGGSGEEACALCAFCGAALAFVAMLLLMTMTAAAGFVYSGLMFFPLAAKKFIILVLYTSTTGVLLDPVPMRQPVAMLMLPEPHSMTSGLVPSGLTDAEIYDTNSVNAFNETAPTPLAEELAEAYADVRAIPIDLHAVQVNSDGHVLRVFRVREDTYVPDARQSWRRAGAYEAPVVLLPGVNLWSWRRIKWFSDAVASTLWPYQAGYRFLAKGTLIALKPVPRGHGPECNLDETPAAVVMGQHEKWHDPFLKVVPFPGLGDSDAATNKQHDWWPINISKFPRDAYTHPDLQPYDGPMPPKIAAGTQFGAISPEKIDLIKCRNSWETGPTRCALPAWKLPTDSKLFNQQHRLQAREAGMSFPSEQGGEMTQAEWEKMPKEVADGENSLPLSTICVKIADGDGVGSGPSYKNLFLRMRQTLSLQNVPVLLRHRNEWIPDGSQVVDARNDYGPETWHHLVRDAFYAKHPDVAANFRAEGREAHDSAGSDAATSSSAAAIPSGDASSQAVGPASGPPLPAAASAATGYDFYNSQGGMSNTVAYYEDGKLQPAGDEMTAATGRKTSTIEQQEKAAMQKSTRLPTTSSPARQLKIQEFLAGSTAKAEGPERAVVDPVSIHVEDVEDNDNHEQPEQHVADYSARTHDSSTSSSQHFKNHAHAAEKRGASSSSSRPLQEDQQQELANKNNEQRQKRVSGRVAEQAPKQQEMTMTGTSKKNRLLSSLSGAAGTAGAVGERTKSRRALAWERMKSSKDNEEDPISSMKSQVLDSLELMDLFEQIEDGSYKKSPLELVKDLKQYFPDVADKMLRDPFVSQQVKSANVFGFIEVSLEEDPAKRDAEKYYNIPEDVVEREKKAGRFDKVIGDMREEMLGKIKKAKKGERPSTGSGSSSSRTTSDAAQDESRKTERNNFEDASKNVKSGCTGDQKVEQGLLLRKRAAAATVASSSSNPNGLLEAQKINPMLDHMATRADGATTSSGAATTSGTPRVEGGQQGNHEGRSTTVTAASTSSKGRNMKFA
ncbi:unnamed protein product [Amoebophrya sp. A120]|nr:unnamed protein product [Amoebophrya sp. A120]|eukprot:GSA120T00017295001.1